MILLCGIPSESPIARVAQAADDLGIAYAMVNQREAAKLAMALYLQGPSVSGVVSVGGHRIALGDVRGIYLRFMDVEELPEVKSAARSYIDPIALERIRALHDIVCEFAEVTDARVLNRHSAMASNGSKPFQAQLIRAAGFAVPETVVTNDPDVVRAFRASHGRVIFKSTSALRSIVRELDDAGLGQLDRLRALPTQFQAYVPGTNVRVHVVGRALFATEVRTEAVDYRYAGRDGLEVTMEPIDLPTKVADRCFRLSAALDLPLCGIDLKRTPDGAHYCFEVNPSPAFTYYEDHTGQPIAQAIARHLAGLSP